MWINGPENLQLHFFRSPEEAWMIHFIKKIAIIAIVYPNLQKKTTWHNLKLQKNLTRQIFKSFSSVVYTCLMNIRLKMHANFLGVHLLGVCFDQSAAGLIALFRSGTFMCGFLCNLWLPHNLQKLKETLKFATDALMLALLTPLITWPLICTLSWFFQSLMNRCCCYKAVRWWSLL